MPNNIDDMSMEEYFLHMQKEEGVSFVNDEGRAQLGYKDRETIEEKLREYVNSLDKETMAKIHEQETQKRIEYQVRSILKGELKRLKLGAKFEHELQAIGKRVVFDKLFGYGPIQSLVENPKVSEIMVNGVGPEKIYYEENGELHISDSYFTSEEQLLSTIRFIASDVNRKVDETSPIVDARLKNGSRVNAAIPPIALSGPCMSIRKFNHTLDIQALIKNGTLNMAVAAFLQYCVIARLNILVFGGTGSGKTTMLNILSSFIPESERIVTIEDSAELRLHQKHVISMETKPANNEGKNEITIRDLIKNSLRMRPDRIIVGECRGGETLDMLQAMNTGHDGSLSTGHASSKDSVISRLETMVLMAGMDLPLRAIRNQIAEAIQLFVEIQKIKTASGRYRRVIKSISYTDGIDANGEIVLTSLFLYDKTEDSIGFTGVKKPWFAERLEELGYSWPKA